MYTFFEENPMGKEINIFISHSSLDEHIATALESYLCEGLKIDLKNIFRFTRENSIPNGANFHNFILNAIKESNIAIFLTTPNSIESRYCYYEMGACWALGITPFIIYFEPLSVSDNIFKNLPFTQVQSSNVIFSDKDSIYKMINKLNDIIYGHSNEPDDLTIQKDKFIKKIQNEAFGTSNLNLQDGRIFVYHSYSDTILKLKKSSKNEVSFCIDYSELIPKFTGYAVRLHGVSWSSFFENDYAFSLNFTPQKGLRYFFIEFKGNDNGENKKIIGRKKITVSENDYNKNIHCQFLLKDVNVNSIYWKQMSEIVILFIDDSVNNSSELSINDVCLKK